LDLVLHLSLSTDTGGPKAFDITFNSASIDTTGKLPVVEYNMLWRAADTTSWFQYCIDSSSAADKVVFQEGMAVDPNNAAVTRDLATAGFTTLSCRKGAMATVHWWGYPYRVGADTFFFDSGLHMKRASYCGDDNHYTISGTQILIHDSAGINAEPITHVEAFWNQKGAICVNMAYRRYLNTTFNGWCNGAPLPNCAGFPNSTTYLKDGAASKQ